MRHLSHCPKADKVEVERINAKQGKDKDLAMQKIRNMGNFRHNLAVLSEGKGELIVCRRPSKKVKPRTFSSMHVLFWVFQVE
jgi:hypothetical protein